MSDAQRTIDLIFNGVDKTGAATLSALNNAEKFSSSLQNITRPISDFTVGAVKLEAGLLLAGAAMTAFAVSTAAGFDAAFREISTIVPASAEELDKFRAAILDYASTSTQPLEKITGALGAAIGSGVDYAESLSLLAAAEKLAVATRSDLDGTTKVLVSTLNSYGLGIEDAGKISDIFFKVIDEGDIKMGDLAASFAKVAPIAKISGVSLEEVGAAIATLTASGIKPAESIEYLRGAISNIISPSSQGAALAKELGIEFNAAGLKANGLAGLLQQVAEKTGGSADKMKLLFGDIGGFTAAATLAGPQAAKFAETLQAMSTVAGSTDKAFEKLSGSIEVQAAKMSAVFKALLVNIGTPLLDEFGGIAAGIAAIFAALNKSVTEGGLKTLVKFVEGILGDLQATFEKVARNLPEALKGADFSGFTGGVSAVVDAVKRLFGGIDITSVDGLTRAIELAGTAFLGLSRFTAGVIDSFKPLVDLIVRMGSNLGKADTAWLEFAGNIGGAVAQFNFVLGAIGGLVPAVEVLVGLMVANNALSLLSAVRTVAGALPALGAAFGVAGAAFAGAFAIEKLYQVVSGLLQLKEAQENLAQAQERARIETERGADTIARFVETTGLAVNSVDEAMALVDAGQVVWSEAANGWVQVGSAMDTAAQSADGVVDPFGEANRKMIEAADAAAAAEDAAGGLTKAQKDVATYTMKVVEIIDSATGKVIGYEQQLVRTEGSGRRLGAATQDAAKELKTSGDVMEQLGRKTDLTNKELIELAKNVRDAEIRLEEIASNERIRFFEAKVALDVADIEAGTKRIEAAFSSINTTIDSTASVLGGLFALFKDENSLSFRAMSDIRDQIEEENKLRREAFELQKKLTEEQIREMQARTRRMEQGDAIIKISGDGLKPHLEAMMWEVFKAVQVRVNQQGLSMLMGA